MRQAVRISNQMCPGNILNEWMLSDDMVDAWREENPYKRAFSRRQMVMGSLKQSRIDLCLIKREILSYVKNVKYSFLGISDHAAMTSKDRYKYGRKRRGGVVFELQLYYWRKAYKENIRKCINYEMENPLFEENVCEWWERMKEKIKKEVLGMQNKGIL